MIGLTLHVNDLTCIQLSAFNRYVYIDLPILFGCSQRILMSPLSYLIAELEICYVNLLNNNATHSVLHGGLLIIM